MKLVSFADFQKMALQFPETVELAHFDRTSFRVKGKIFATYDFANNRAMVKLSLLDQSVFSAFDKTIIYPVPGGWGKNGATYFELKKIKKPMLRDALTTAWLNVAPPSLRSLYRIKKMITNKRVNI